MIGRRALPWLAAPALAQAPLTLLSGGALEPPLHAALALWPGPPPAVTFNTAPAIAARLAAGERPDVLLAPLATFTPLGITPTTLGGVSVGVALREGAPEPGITDEASFRAAVLAADALIFNRASTGLYMDRLFARLGLTEAIAGKSVRFPDGDAVLRRVASGQGREIGFAAVTEILLFRGRGVRLAPPLPAALGNATQYGAAALTARGRPMLDFLAGEAARNAMRVAGLE